MNKIEKNGKIAVVYSPGYGAGWSTWVDDEIAEKICMDADVVQCVIDGDNDKAASVAVEKYGEFYTGGSDDLRVAWIDKGSAFEIQEYDGNESIRIIGDVSFFVA